MLNILIADDHAIVRKGLIQVLEDFSEINSIDEAENGFEVEEMVRENHYDLVILDLSMPGRGGLDTLKQVKIDNPLLPVLILSIHPEEQYAVRLLKAGASGFLNKASAPEELVSAIKKVVSGGKYISSSMAEHLASEIEKDSTNMPHERLSDREYQVMVMIASGKTVSEIAQTLNLSVKTISTYRTRILEKMELENNAKLVHYALQQNLL
jgi:two-component system, NarL family, invasion response regulator UvrY